MKRTGVAQTLAWTAAAGYLLVAALHGSAYGRVMAMAEPAPDTVRRVLAVLWLSASVDLVAFGLIVGLASRVPGALGAGVVALAALCPLAVAGLQVAFLGFIPPSAMLLVLAVLTLGAAMAKRGA